MSWRPAPPLSTEELASLAVFPLPRLVFFPGTTLPLHLFEPRYRRMIEDCLRSGSMALAVTMLEAGWEDADDGRPAIHSVAGAGRIVAHQRRENGTHDILLQGLHRVRLQEIEETDLPYRRAQATPIADVGDAQARDLMAMMACANEVAARITERQPDFRLQLPKDLSAGRTADLIADQLVADPEQRQRILELNVVEARVTKVTEAVASLLAQLSDGEPAS